MSRIHTWFCDEVLGASAIGPLALFDWHATPTPKQIELTYQHLPAHLERYPQGTLMFAVVRESVRQIPTKGTADAVSDFMRRFKTEFRYRIAVIEGSGIIRPFIRSFLFGLNSVLGDTTSSRIVATLEEATSWTAERMQKLDPSITLDGAALHLAILRAQKLHDQAQKTADAPHPTSP